MKQRELCNILDRLKTILHSLKNQCSGADVHTVGNIKNTVSMLLEELEDTEVELFRNDSEIMQMVSRAESNLVDFYKKKYPILAYQIKNKNPEY
ncbi:MAG: hypothetical protein ACRCST_00680 [Turicibacter sp.]